VTYNEENNTWTGSMTEPVFGASIGVQTMRVHARKDCAGRHCVFHNPSEHHMRAWGLHFRADRYQMERVCPHGVGHPDPDDLAYHVMVGRSEAGIHGCDGCCGLAGVAAAQHVDGPSDGGNAVLSLV
jgi:hypothetical protein